MVIHILPNISSLDFTTNATSACIPVSFAIILVVIGAYKIMTAGGSPDNVHTGRNYIMWAMVGLGVALLARSIPAIVQAVLRIS